MLGQIYFKTWLEHIPASRVTVSDARNTSKALDKCCHWFSNQSFPQKCMRIPIYYTHLAPPAVIILNYLFCCYYYLFVNLGLCWVFVAVRAFL